MSSHKPVLLNETMESLAIRNGSFAIDGTMDGGGHAEAMLGKIMPEGTFLGIDLDIEMVRRAKERFGEKKNIRLVCGNYTDLPAIMQSEGLLKADALLLDLGFSSEQLTASGKGFSFEKDEPLLMAYGENETPAYEILSRMNEREIADMIFNFGGERQSRRIAKAIVEARRKSSILRSGQLAEIVKSALPGNYERGRIHPATRTFQALRIYVNHELENIEEALGKLPEILKSGGRVAVISFHSLEDKIVKNTFKKMEKEKILKIMAKKPISASDTEARENPRSRSAKLRTAEIL